MMPHWHQLSLTFNSLLTVVYCLLLMLSLVNASCKEHVMTYCGNMGCQQGLLSKKLDMHFTCQKLRDGTTDECSDECQVAITELLTAYNGSEGIFTCNCNDTLMFYGQDDCELDRRRLSLCPPLAALFPTDPPHSSPCIAASQDCEGDANCKSRLDAYLESCNPEQSYPETTPCSRECTGSLEALRAEPLASNFWECSCAAETPDNWCRTSPHVYQQLCQVHVLPSTSDSPEVPYKPVVPKPTSPPVKTEEQSQQSQGSAEDNSANQDKKGPDNAAPSTTKSQTLLSVLVASFFGMLVLCIL